jgi:hypothetical protein
MCTASRIHSFLSFELLLLTINTKLENVGHTGSTLGNVHCSTIGESTAAALSDQSTGTDKFGRRSVIADSQPRSPSLAARKCRGVCYSDVHRSWVVSSTLSA